MQSRPQIERDFCRKTWIIQLLASVVSLFARTLPVLKTNILIHCQFATADINSKLNLNLNNSGMKRIVSAMFQVDESQKLHKNNNIKKNITIKRVIRILNTRRFPSAWKKNLCYDRNLNIVQLKIGRSPTRTNEFSMVQYERYFNRVNNLNILKTRHVYLRLSWEFYEKCAQTIMPVMPASKK